MDNKARKLIYICVSVACSVASSSAQEQWELGVAGGYGAYSSVTATNPAGEASVGFKPGIAFGVVAGNESRNYLSGEVRYTYRLNDLKVSGAGTEVRFDGESHVLNYDFLFHFADRTARVRPFAAAGAGVKIYRGTGIERAFQPLSRFAVLTKGSQIAPVVSVGAGLKVQLTDLLTLRIEGRDFASTFPDEVIAPVPGTRVSGWLHDFVPLVGLSFRFGR
jgi:opacity protein-like surface antigen